MRHTTMRAVRILILDTYYPRFLRTHYAGRRHLSRAPYDEQHRALMERSFGTSDAYSHFLRALGHEAEEVVVNCAPLQAQWAKERGRRTFARALGPLTAAGGRAVSRLTDSLHQIVLAQIAAFRPDVVYVQDMGFHTTRQVNEFRAAGGLVVGQIASKAPAESHLRAFDLITTSFPHFVERFHAMGIDAAYFRIGFDERVVDRLGREPRAPDVDVAFVGGLHPRVHGTGVRLLERLCTELGSAVAVYGYGARSLPRSSPIRACYRGEAWGLDMYRVLAGARIAFNRHIDAAEGYANNMRLYEATGVGAALVTDAGRNLGELFEPDREVAVYASGEEAATVTRALLEDEPRRAAIAAAGQARTLREHTYRNRMAELLEILQQRLDSR